MTQHPVFKFVALLLLVLSVGAIVYRQPEAWMLLIGLIIIAAATVWLLVSLIRRPQEAGKSFKSWLRTMRELISGL